MEHSCLSEFECLYVTSKCNNVPSNSTVDVSGNYLRFNRIAPADEGRYVCTASNRYGNTTKVAEVIVNSTDELKGFLGLKINFCFLLRNS